MFLASTPAGAGTQKNCVYASSYTGIDPTGTTDSGAVVNSLMQTLAGTGTVLVVDCPIKISITNNVNAPIFVPSFLDLQFTSSGMFIVDNILIPAFCFLHTTDCTWSNPHFRYVGTLPLDANPDTGASNYAYFGAWNNVVTSFLANNYQNTFVNGGSAFSSGINGAAILSFRGECARLTFDKLVLDVPPAALATHFIPFGISLYPEWMPGATVTNTTQQNASNTSVPSQIYFNQPQFDGFFIGVTGAGGFEMNEPIFKRYSDLQDSSYTTNTTGANWGGSGSSVWFPSPHCITTSSITTSSYLDAAILTQTKVINNGFDFGMYVGGTTRRKSTSGSMCALSCSADGSTRVNGFKTLRPDGLIDFVSYNVNPPGGAELNDLEASAYNSSLTRADGGTFPAVRFLGNTAGNDFTNVFINRISVTDVSPTPAVFAIQGVGLAGNSNITIENLHYYLSDMPTMWGFNTQGANMSLSGDIYLTNCTGTLINKGIIYNITSNITNSYYDLRVWGWRVINNLTFTAAPSGTSATLSANWLFPTDAYVVTFPSGQMRVVNFTLNSTSASWSGSLSELSSSFTVSCINSNNINSYKNNMKLGSGATGTYARVRDMSNGITQEADDGVITETWSQCYYGSPTGLSQSTTISFSSAYAIDRAGVNVITTLGSVSSFGVGWSGIPTALLAAQSASSTSNSATPLDNTWPKSLGGSAQNIILTPTSGSFNGVGELQLTVRGTTMYGAG